VKGRWPERKGKDQSNHAIEKGREVDERRKRGRWVGREREKWRREEESDRVGKRKHGGMEEGRFLKRKEGYYSKG
jgi:hypothetical protein